MSRGAFLAAFGLAFAGCAAAPPGPPIRATLLVTGID